MNKNIIILSFKIILINLFVFYCLAEIILLILDLPRNYLPHTYPVQFKKVNNKEVMYLNNPGKRLEFQYDGNPRGYFRADNIVDHKTNRYGFRGEEFRYEKQPGVFRVLFLGDSFTFGEGVYFDDVYSHVFEKKANNLELFGKKKVESINLGVGGFNSQQQWALLKELGPKLNPDLIILGYNLNDAEDYIYQYQGKEIVRRKRAVEEEIQAINAEIPPGIIRLSRLYRFVWRFTRQIRISQATIKFYHLLYQEDSIHWQKNRDSLLAIAKYAQGNNIPLTVLIFPVLYKMSRQYPFLPIHTRLHEIFTANQVDYVDLFPLLKGYKDSALWVHPEDHHPNEQVHRITAETLIKHFEKIPNGK